MIYNLKTYDKSNAKNLAECLVYLGGKLNIGCGKVGRG
jgi:hypothetical protein